MPEYYQILLDKSGDLAIDGEIVVFSYGPEGWLERVYGEDDVAGYRLIDQREGETGFIVQTVEKMPDGWAPGSIYFQDVI